MSTPARSKWVAVVCRMTCGLIAFFVGVRSTPNWWGYLIAVPLFCGAAVFVITAVVAIATKPAAVSSGST